MCKQVHLTPQRHEIFGTRAALKHLSPKGRTSNSGRFVKSLPKYDTVAGEGDVSRIFFGMNVVFLASMFV